MTRVRMVLVGAILPILIVVAWWTLSAGSTNPFYPPLSSIMETFQKLWFHEPFVTNVIPSLRNAVVGFAIASVVGVLVAYLMTRWSLMGRVFTPVVYFFQSVPDTALLPVALILLGIGVKMHIAMIVVAALPSILLNAVTGFKSVDPVLRDTVRIYPASAARELWSVQMPAAAPHILAGMRTGLRRAILMMVAAELVGADRGIGYFTLQASRSFRVDDMWAGILLLGFIGYVLNVAFQIFENRVLKWYLAPRRNAR